MNKLPELQNRDLRKLEQKFDIGNAKLLGERVSHLRHMKVLRKTDFYADWMGSWIHWKDGEYYGAAPDEEVIAHHSDPLTFLKLYKEACDEWERQERLTQEGL